MCVKVIALRTMMALRLEITNTCYELYLELGVFMKLWCLLDSSSTQGDSVGFLDGKDEL